MAGWPSTSLPAPHLVRTGPLLPGDPGNGGGWELVADGWAQGLFKAAARGGGLLCWVFSGAVATHNGGPGMPPFFAFFFYTCSATCSSEGSQPFVFSSCQPHWALPRQSLGAFSCSCSPFRASGGTLQGSLAGQIPTLLSPPYPSQHRLASRPCLSSSSPRGPFLPLST